MTQTEIDRFRIRLLELKSELEALEAGSVESTQPVELDQACFGRLTRMDAMQAQQMAQEIARRRQRQLVKITGALRRIDAGEFGDCFVCGKPIDARRLEADPSTTRCPVCVDD